LTASARDPDPLALPTRELVRKAVDVLGVQADALEEPVGLALDLVARHSTHLQRGREDLGDSLARVERRLRVLEDHLHLATDRRHLAAPGLRDVGATEADRAGGHVDQPHERADQRRLPAPGLADDPERLAAVQSERHVVDGVDVTDLPVDDHSRLDREQHPQVLDLEQVRAVRGRGLLRFGGGLGCHQLTASGLASPI
jgi:hypothetical protein